jgi:hypothetical protein
VNSAAFRQRAMLVVLGFGLIGLSTSDPEARSLAIQLVSFFAVALHAIP